MIRVAINGFGRIGRIAFRQMITSTDFDIVAINSRHANPEEFAYLIKYDSVFRSFHENEIKYDDKSLIIADKKVIPIFESDDPETLPWKDLNVDLVLECTGAFTSTEKASKHIKAGAKKVLISAPGKDEMKTIVYGVNETILDGNEQIVSAASCTTNALAPMINVLNNNVKIINGFMSTIHAYTFDQNALDNTHTKGSSSRRGRASAQNIVPASTGAAKTIGKVIPTLNEKLDGVAFRVPVSDGSMVDLTLNVEGVYTKEDINNILTSNQNEIMMCTNDPVVSSDIIGKKCGCLVDLDLTNVLVCDNKSIVKCVCWYDNEYGYTAQMLRTAKAMFR